MSLKAFHALQGCPVNVDNGCNCQEILQMDVIQAEQVVAKAQQAAAEATHRSEEESSRLKRDLEALKKEKRGLVQRCTSAERDLAAAVV